MHLTFGKYQIVSTPFRPRIFIATTPERTQECEEALDHLAELLGENFPWKLSGGLSIPTTTGKWYREHHDLDILIPENSLSALVERIKLFGYHLFSLQLCLRFPLYHKIDIYRSITPDVALRKKLGHMYVIKTDSQGIIQKQRDLLHHIDIYSYTPDDTTLQSHKFPRRFPASFLAGHSYTTRSGRLINIVNLKYVQKIKSISLGTVDRRDIQQIEEWAHTQQIFPL